MSLSALLLKTVKRYEAALLICGSCPKSDRAECIAAFIRSQPAPAATAQPQKKTLLR